MKYLVCYVWNNTRGNHAGMAHMCDLLKRNWPQEYEVIRFYDKPIIDLLPSKKMNRVIGKIEFAYHNWRKNLRLEKMYKCLKDGDKVFLLEYLHPDFDLMRPIAHRIKSLGHEVTVYGLAHLTPSYLVGRHDITSEYIEGWNECVDLFLTFGHSLSDYLISLGVQKSHVKTLFHYVDAEYYHPSSDNKVNNVQVLVQGNLQRDYGLLESVVHACPDVEFVICAGIKILSQFKKYANVRLLGYVSENQLRMEMDNALISLNIMEDTVGSNVITTSLAMGMAMIVSDVGSIRDYCDDSNALFCKTKEDFVNAINNLCNNRTKLIEMCRMAQEKSKKFTIFNFHRALSEL